MNSAAAAKTRVLIVDDHPIVREGLATLINRQSDLMVCGEVENGSQALKAMTEVSPDLAIIDISMEGMNGISLIKRIRRQDDQCPILVLSMHDEFLYAERALSAGARGYVMKQESGRTLLKAIRKVRANEIWVSEAMVDRVLSKIVAGTGVPIAVLSDRELEVFLRIGRGQRPRSIAESLNISIRTVGAHRENIKKKLNLKDARALMQCAMQWIMDEAASG